MATKAAQSFENPLYSDSGGSLASQMSTYGFLNPAASSGSDALQQGLADIAAIGQAGMAATRFELPPMKRPPAIQYSPSKKKLAVQGVTFDEDDADMTLRAEALLDQPPVGTLQGGDWITLTPEAYGQLTNSIRNPGLGRLMSKNFGIGVDQLQMLAGRGMQLAGAEQTGQAVVDQQMEDLRKNLPYRREFSDIDSTDSAIEWLAATVAQQGPNILESVGVAAAGFFGGTAAAGGNPVVGAGAALAGLAGKTAFKQSVLAALKKRAAGEALQATEKKLLREAAGITGATITGVANNYGMGAADIYGEFREQGSGADDANARLAALTGAVPFALLESLPEFILASRLFGAGGLSARSGATALKDIQGTNMLTTGLKRGGELLKRGAKGATVGGFAEGGTELGQESLLIGLTGQDFGDADVQKRLVESFAAGFGVGGTIGAGANLRRGPITKQPTDLLNPSAPTEPDLSASTEVAPTGEGTTVGGFGQRPDFVAGEGGVRPSTPGDRIYTGEVQPNQFGGAQGVLDLGGIPVAEAKARSMQVGAGAPARVWDVTTQSFRDVTPEEQAAQVGPQDLRPDPRQGALQFAPPAPAGVGFTEQTTVPTNPIMQIQMQLAQARQAQEQAAQQQAAQREADLNRLAVQAQNQRQLDLIDQTVGQEEPAPTMPMRPVNVRQPQQLSLFSRREAPTPSRAEGLRRGVGTQLPVSTPMQVAPRADLRTSRQIPMFTQQGEPSMAALKSAAKPTPVQAPTVQAGATQAPPTGRPVTAVTAAAAAQKQQLKRGSGTIQIEDATYSGQLKAGQPHGQGTMTYGDGSTYAGKFKDGLPDGQGRFEDVDGTVMDGKFVAGEFQGEPTTKPQPQEKPNAVQERSPKKVDARQQAGDGKAVGEEDTGRKETPAKGKALKKQEAKQEPDVQAVTEPDETPPTPPKGGKKLKKAPAKKTEAKGTAAPKAAQLQKGPSGLAAMVGQLMAVAKQGAVVESKPAKRGPKKTDAETTQANEKLDFAIESAETTKNAATYADALYDIVEAFAFSADRTYLRKTSQAFLEDGVPKGDFIGALRELALNQGEITTRQRIYGLLAENGLLNDVNVAALVQQPGGKAKQEAVIGEDIGANGKITPEESLANFLNSTPQWPRRQQLVDKLNRMYAAVTNPDFVIGVRGKLSDFFDADGDPIIAQPAGVSYFTPTTVAEQKVSKEEFVNKHNQARKELREAEDVERQSTLDDLQYDPLLDNVFGNTTFGTDTDGRFYRADGRPVAPMKVGPLQMFVARVISKYARKPIVNVFANLADMKRKNPTLFNAAAKARRDGDIEAVNAAAMAWGNNVVLFSDFIGSEDHARFIIAHETLGHVGFRGLFSDAALNKILQLVADSDPTLSHAAEVYANGRGIPFLEAVEEVLADRAAALDGNTILRFWNWVKDQLNKLGLKFQDDAARYLIGLSRKYIRQGTGRSEVNMSGLFKGINESLANEQSDLEVLRFAQAMPMGEAMFKQNMLTQGVAMYGGVERSIRDIIQAKQKAEEMRKQGKGVLKNVTNVVQKVLDGIQTQDNMARKSKGYFKVFERLQSQAARQTELKTRYSEMTKLAHEAKFLGFGKGMTPEQTLRASQLLAYATLFKMNQYSDTQLSDMGNPMAYDTEYGLGVIVKNDEFKNLKRLGLMTVEQFRSDFKVQQGTQERPMTPERLKELEAERDADIKDLEKAKAKVLARLKERLDKAEDKQARLEFELRMEKAEKEYTRDIEAAKRKYTKLMAEKTYDAPNMVSPPEWFKDLKEDDIEYQVYKQFFDAVSQSAMDVLHGKYVGAIHEQRAAIAAGVSNSFRVALDAREMQFIQAVTDQYDQMRLKDSKIKNNRLALDEDAQRDANEWLRMKFARAFYNDLALGDLAKTVDGYSAEQVDTLVRGMRKKLKAQINPDLDDSRDSSIWALEHRIEERTMFVASINDDQLYAKRTITGSYVPLTRDGEWQVRLQAFTTVNGQDVPVKLKQSQQDSLFYGKSATEKDALGLADELDGLFGGEYDMRTADGTLQTVKLRAIVSAAEQTPALVDILHYDEVMYSLSRLGIQLSPEKQEVLVKKVSAQNSRARSNLQRANVAGWDADVVRSASAFLEQQAYTAANKEFRHQYDEILETPENWVGDPVRLAELKTKWDNATGPAKELAAREYFQEKYYYDNANEVVDGRIVQRGNYYKERVKSLLDWRDSTGDIIHADDIWTNNEWSVAARTWTALAQLGGSIATGITQMISLPTNSWAYLSAFNPKTGFGVGLGAGRAATLLLEYAKKAGNFKLAKLEYIEEQIAEMVKSGAQRSRDGLSIAELNFLKDMTEEQRLDAAQFNALTGTSRGRKITGNPTAQKFIQVWMFPFAYSEQFNRRVTLLAAYRGEYDRQIASGAPAGTADVEARRVASRAVDATQGDYAQYNRPAYFRGGLQSFVYMYKQYPIMMVQLLKNMNYEGRIIMLGSLILLSGLRGLPGADDILDIVDGLAQRLGLKIGSVEKEFARLTRNVFGDELAAEINPIMMRGLLDHFTGMSFSNRLGLGDIIPGTGILKPSATKQEILREIENLAGAPTSFLFGALEYVSGTLPAVATGRQGFGALLRDAPIRAVANLGDSFKYYNTGAIVDKKGYVVAQNASAMEILGKAIGFHPSRAQMQMDWMMADSQEQAYMSMIKTEAVRRAVGARLEGDADTERVVKEYIADWNEATKGTRLEIRNFNKSINQAYREAKKPLAMRSLKSSAKGGRAEAKEMLRFYGVDEETLAGIPD